MEIAVWLCLATSAAAVVLMIILLLRQGKSGGGQSFDQKELDALRRELQNEIRASQNSNVTLVQNSVGQLGQGINNSINQAFDRQDKRIGELVESLTTRQNELKRAVEDKMDEFKRAFDENIKALRASVAETNKQLSDAQDKLNESQQKLLREQLEATNKNLTESLTRLEKQFESIREQNTKTLDSIRETVENKLVQLQTDNAKQLDKMRETVDEKLQKTLDDRISQSFKMVNDRLGEVYQGLGEMKTLAGNVGDLKKVLSNVKTRGIMGELALGAIMQEMLTPDQYDENVVTKLGSANRVEFAIKLPGTDDGHVYLPVDSKFPADVYHNLVDAYETGDAEQIKVAVTALEQRIKGCAKDIHDKYIDPPNTTNFGIMFLPFEGLYSEVVRRGLVDELQRTYQISVAGPTTFSALLNSLRMGFRTLAIQKHSDEVWQVLGAVKTEFGKFSDALKKAQTRIKQTGDELEMLVGTRTNMMNRRLSAVSAELTVEDSKKIIDAVADSVEE